MKGLLVLLTSASLVAFTGCDAFKPTPSQMEKITKIDPDMHLNREDYRHMTAPKSDGSEAPEPLNVIVNKGVPPIPQLAEILAAPRPPKIGETQLVSIAVTDDVPLKDVLLELAKLADVDIELDSGITGGISFIAKEKPFNEVIERIASLADLRYTMKEGVLRVERDTPFIKSYTVDFLNLDRDATSSSNLSTNVLSTSVGGGGGSSGVTTGSTSTLNSKTKGDFWDSLQTGLDQIIAYQPARHSSTTTLQAENDTSMLTSSTPPAAGSSGTAAGGGGAGGAAPAATPAPATPAAAPAAAAPAAGGTTSGKQYTINRQAGIITLNGTSKQHELVESLLAKLKSNSSAQVLIEAKIIEVDLSETYKTGINWSVLSKKVQGGVTFNDIGNALASTPTSDIATVALASGDLQSIISLVETFGTTRTLSSPRLHAINNQPSTLTFAINKVYYQVTATQSPATTVGTTTSAPIVTVSSTVKTVPIGIIMSIMPSIDLENNEVTLAVRPTLSTLNGPGVPDPAVAYLVASLAATNGGTVPDISSITPEVQVRELDSTVRMKSGQTMVIGGLMQQTGTNADAGVPFVDSIPVLGNLFKSVDRESTNKELVLLIKATIVDTKGSVGKPDKEIFHQILG